MDLLDPATAPYLISSVPRHLDLGNPSPSILPPQQTGRLYTDEPMTETQASFTGAGEFLGSESAALFDSMPSWFPEFFIDQEKELNSTGHQLTDYQPQTGQHIKELSPAMPLDAASSLEITSREYTDSHFSISLSNEVVEHLYGG